MDFHTHTIHLIIHYIHLHNYINDKNKKKLRYLSLSLSLLKPKLSPIHSYSYIDHQPSSIDKFYLITIRTIKIKVSFKNVYVTSTIHSPFPITRYFHHSKVVVVVVVAAS